MTDRNEPPLPKLRATLSSFRVLAMLYALFCLMIAGIGYFVFLTQKQAIESNAATSLQHIVQIKSRAVSRWLNERLNDGQALARQLAAHPSTELWLASGSPPDTRGQALREHLKTLEIYNNYRQVAFTDTQGSLLASNQPAQAALDPALAQIAAKAANTRQTQVSRIHVRSEASRFLEFHIATPIVKPSAGKEAILGVVILTVDPERDLLPIVREWPGPSPSSESVIVERDGDSVSYITAPRQSAAEPLAFRRPLDPRFPSSAAVLNTEGTIQASNFRGVPVLAAFTAVQDTPWHLMAKTDQAEVNAPVRRLAMGVGSAAGILFIGGGFVFLTGWRVQQASLIRREQAAEEQAAQSDRALRRTLDSLQDGYLLLDTDWTYLYLNEAAARHGRKLRADLLGKNMLKLYPGIDSTPIFATYQRVMQTRQSEHIEAPFTFEDGTTRWFELLVNPAQEGITILSLDITDRKIAQDAAMRLAQIVESTHDAVFSVDPEGRVTSWNEAAERISGYTAAEVLGQSIDVVTPPQDRALTRQRLDRVLAGETIPDRDVVRIHKDGTQTELSVTLSLIRDSQGNPIGVSGIARDITARKRLEHDIAVSMATLAAEHDLSPDGILVVDQDGQITSANRRFFMIWGLPEEGTIGHPNTDALQKVLSQLVNPEQFLDRIRYLEEHEQESSHEDLQLKDGRTIERHSAPLALSDGQTSGRVWYFRDITARKQADAATSYLAAIVRSSGDAIISTDLDRVVTSWNAGAERLFGRTAAEVIGTKPYLTYLPEERDRIDAVMTRVLAGGETEALEGKRVRSDGTVFYIQGRYSAIRDANGAVTGISAIVQDITSRKLSEEAVSRLAAIVQSSSDAIMAVTPDARVTNWNEGAETLFGYTAAEIIGQPITILAPPHDAQVLLDRIDETLRGADTLLYEATRVRKDGSLIEVSGRLSPIRTMDGTVSGVSAILRDITERKKSERSLLRTTRALRTLSLGNEALVRATTSEGLYQEMCEVIVREGGYRMAWVGLAENDTARTVRPVASAGHDDGYVAAANVTWADEPRGRGPTGTAIREKRAQINRDFMTSSQMAPWLADAQKRGYNSSIAIPLQGRGSEQGQDRAFGAITIYAPEPDAFGPEEAHLLSELAADLSYGILALQDRLAQAAAAQRLERAMEETVGAVATTVEIRDPYTAGHQRRVAGIAVAVANELGLSQDRIHGLRLASEVHDLGKIAIPAQVLTKPTQLTPLEYELIKTHVQAGYDILHQVDFPWPIAEMVLQHHEKIDGSGYPNGLKGEDILLEARILCVADVVESMMTHRPYRPALGLDAALAEIQSGRGRIYDSAVVDACCAVMRQDQTVFSESKPAPF